MTNFTFLSRVMTSCNYFEYLLFYSYQTKKMHFVPQRVGYNTNMCILMAYMYSVIAWFLGTVKCKISIYIILAKLGNNFSLYRGVMLTLVPEV